MVSSTFALALPKSNNDMVIDHKSLFYLRPKIILIVSIYKVLQYSIEPLSIQFSCSKSINQNAKVNIPNGTENMIKYLIPSLRRSVRIRLIP